MYEDAKVTFASDFSLLRLTFACDFCVSLLRLTFASHFCVTFATVASKPQPLRFERDPYGGCDQVVTVAVSCCDQVADLVPSDNHRENLPLLVLLSSLVRRSRRSI